MNYISPSEVAGTFVANGAVKSRLPLRIHRIRLSIAMLVVLFGALCQAQQASSSGSPVSVTVYDRTRVDSWQWFAAPPYVLL